LLITLSLNDSEALPSSEYEENVKVGFDPSDVAGIFPHKSIGANGLGNEQLASFGAFSLSFTPHPHSYGIVVRPPQRQFRNDRTRALKRQSPFHRWRFFINPRSNERRSLPWAVATYHRAFPSPDCQRVSRPDSGNGDSQYKYAASRSGSSALRERNFPYNRGFCNRRKPDGSPSSAAGSVGELPSGAGRKESGEDVSPNDGHDRAKGPWTYSPTVSAIEPKNN
jgi:hypothetical protein